MPGSRSHEPNSRFTTTSMRLRREIKDVLLPQITQIGTLKTTADGIATSTNFQINTAQIAPSTFCVDIKYRQPYIGSTVARIHLDQMAEDLQAAIEALSASLADGWVWQVT